jgi:hypothetical protein
MPKYGAGKTLFLIDGYDVVGMRPQTVRKKTGVETERVDGVGETWSEHAPTGMSFAELAQEGAFWDTTAGRIHSAFSAGTPNDPNAALRIACVAFGGNTFGQPFTGFQGALTPEYEVLSQRGSLQRANATHRISGRAEEGVILHAHGAETGSGGNSEGAQSVDHTTEPGAYTVPITTSVAAGDLINTSAPHKLTAGDTILVSGHSGSTPSLNTTLTVLAVTSDTQFSVTTDITVGGTGGTFVQAKSNQGASGYLEVESVTLGGYTDVTIKVRHSDDDSTYVDLLTFANVTTRNAQRVTVAGAVRRHLAHSWIFNGAGSAQSIAYFCGLARN